MICTLQDLQAVTSQSSLGRLQNFRTVSEAQHTRRSNDAWFCLIAAMPFGTGFACCVVFSRGIHTGHIVAIYGRSHSLASRLCGGKRTSYYGRKLQPISVSSWANKIGDI